MNMTLKRILSLSTLMLLWCLTLLAAEKPWAHGPLCVSSNQRFLMHADGTPFFWQGETAWLMPQRLNRDEVRHYLQQCAAAGYNVVQVQVLNDTPSYNIYGHSSDTDAYWQHLDYIVRQAESNGIYIGMVTIWGSQVKAGRLSEQQAAEYGRFLANRYKDRPNIVWLMGGDIQGDIHPEVWNTLATTIKSIDTQHLMTYHPRGRYTSAHWWSQAPWMDFHTFQSGHRRYGQRGTDKTYPIPDNTEEDNWQYVDSTWAYAPIKPVLDDEPIYEDIPQGLHDGNEPRWTAADVRRYAYWSVFAGSCGHTYGHNSIMQFWSPGLPPAYFCEKPWYEALNDSGFHQMQHLSRLILRFPYFERVPDQQVIRDNGTRYDRLVATRGTNYLLVYNHTGRSMTLDLTRISGNRKQLWWMNAATGQYRHIGEYPSALQTIVPPEPGDGVLIALDAGREWNLSTK